MASACCVAIIAPAGYTYMAGRRYPAPRPVDGATPEPEPTLEEQRAAFETALSAMDAQLEDHDGPFFLGHELSLVDVMYVPTMERLGANLPMARGMDIRTNAAFPRVAAWFAALEALPAYGRVRSDDVTLHLLLRRLFSMAETLPSQAHPAVQEARRYVFVSKCCCAVYVCVIMCVLGCQGHRCLLCVCTVMQDPWCPIGRQQPSWRPITSELLLMCCSMAALCIVRAQTMGAMPHPYLVCLHPQTYPVDRCKTLTMTFNRPSCCPYEADCCSG